MGKKQRQSEATKQTPSSGILRDLFTSWSWLKDHSLIVPVLGLTCATWFAFSGRERFQQELAISQERLKLKEDEIQNGETLHATKIETLQSKNAELESFVQKHEQQVTTFRNELALKDQELNMLRAEKRKSSQVLIVVTPEQLFELFKTKLNSSSDLAIETDPSILGE